MLRSCLASLSELRVPDGWQLQIVIVDNDAEPNAKHIVDGFTKILDQKLHYEHEPNPGIPQARNRAIETALKYNAQYMGFIDDDEKITQNWLINMKKAFDTHQSDVVQGRVNFEYEDVVPFINLKKRNKLRKSGARLRTASTDNVAFSTKLIKSQPDGLGLRFNPKMRYTGGEDIEFFFRATDAGTTIVWSNKPTVSELIPRSRATLLWQLRRSYRSEANAALIYKQRKGAPHACMKYLPKVLARVFLSFFFVTLMPLFLVFDSKRAIKLGLMAMKNIMSSGGAITGLFGAQPEPYRVVDGE